MKADASKVLASAKKLIVPSSAEAKKVSATTLEIIAKVNSALKKKEISARLIIGGSIAKNTWLPGISDIDAFILFNYKKYSEWSDELSDIAEPVVRSCFKNVMRVHGSRDYFIVKLDGLTLEIVPVLEIKNHAEAKNITDSSPLHIYWLKKQFAKKPALATEIRLAKSFFKAQKVYGAESYIGGFSGHVIEILTCYYGSFISLIKNMEKIESKTVIDIMKHYVSGRIAFASMNESKLSPLIVIDPIQRERNAAAALNKTKLMMLKTSCSKFLSNPSLDFFKEVEVIPENIPEKKNKKLIIFEAKPYTGKPDVVGSKLFKKFTEIKQMLVDNEFKFEGDWYWKKTKNALFWFYLDTDLLSKKKLHFGPPMTAKKEDIAKFKAKWKKQKVFKQGNRFAVELPRKYRDPLELLKTIENKELKIIIIKNK